MWYVSSSNGHFSNTLAHQMMTVSPSLHDFKIIDYRRIVVYSLCCL